LVGRGEQVAQLRGALTRVEHSESVTVAIRGEPGIGKSRLLDELVSMAEDSGHLSLSGRAAQLERDVPFAIFVDALDGYLGSQSARRFEALGGERLGDLGRILPSFESFTERAGTILQSERYRAHRAVAALLRLLARREPVLLALDDVQWADEASLELVAHLLRHPPDARVLLALAYRPGEAPAPLAAALEDEIREERLEIVQLEPLSRSEASKMMPEGLDSATRDWLHRESGGNPFYLHQLEQSLDPESAPPLPEPAPRSSEGVPAAVAAAIAREIAGLGRGARKLIEGAAVAGDPFSLDLAAAGADIAGGESRDALDELVEHELVHTTEEPRRFRFRHPIVQRSIYLALKSGWRLGAHARLRDLLEEQSSSVMEVAHHVEQSASPGDLGAVASLELAAHEAEALGPSAAAHWFGAALRLLPEDAVDRRLELLMRMAGALAGAGRLEQARGALLEALDCMPEEGGEEEITLVSSLAELDILLGRLDEARDRLRSALLALPDSAAPEATAFQCALAMTAIYDAGWEEGRWRGQQALEGANRSGEPGLRAIAEGVLSFALHGLGQVADAERHTARAAELLDGLDDLELGGALDAVYHLGLSEYCLERYAEGARHLGRGVEVAHLTRQGRLLNNLKGCRAWCLVHLGSGPDASRLIEEAMDGGRLEGNPQSLAWLLGIGSWIACLLGDVQLAMRRGEEAVAIGSERDESGMSHTGSAQLGYAYAEAGEYERCLEQMERAGAPELDAFFDAQRAPCFEALSLASLGLGRMSEAEAWAERAEVSAAAAALPGAVGCARRARARLLLALDQPARAASLAGGSVEGLEAGGARLEAGRTRILAGRAWAAAAERDRATEELERAYEELDDCGAARRRDEAAMELRRLGRSVPRGGRRGSAPVGVDGLSEREREIAELVAEAKTNREIASALFISEKTVEKHLSKVFAKLDVPGRAAVGSKLAATEK
jgi:ATP/maltotriose-dependent transcriptional regulator MalT